MKKTSTESHHILVEAYGEHTIANECAKSDLNDLKVVILAWKTTNVLAVKKV